MEYLYFNEILEAVNGQMLCAGKNVKVKGVSIDSRTIQNGDIFFALKGERVDGHHYIVPAMKAGAVGAVVSHVEKIDSGYEHFPVIRVKDTVTALGDLARYYRQKLTAKIIGITGSNGKTTTKEMTYHVLSQFGSVVRSQRSFNNFIGVPVTIFEIENRHQYGVLEMGTNAPGEIRRLSEIGAPDIAVILNVSQTHLEGLGSMAGVASAKGEILENLSKDGVFVYNVDNLWCVKIADGFKGKKVGFGFSPHAHIRCTNAKRGDEGYRLVINGCLEIYLPVPGYHNITNCLASFAVCHALGHNIYHLKEVFSSFKLPQMRIEHQRIGNITFINDAYNANPESVRAALAYLHEINTKGRKVFICGDMLELGSDAVQLHREIGETVAHLGIDLLWAVGNYAAEIAKAAKLAGMPDRRVVSFKDVADIAASEMSEFRENDTVLIKGSRGMRMENILEKFRNYG
ncbi:MAG: UDP-N-acetylmuramoyl-tripeptide--D-alanyl-D-alanine ligase [Candidatus Brocadia sp. WS118]|nr:MAG: UDP-N-acetylmuramoyl-tripeptide--D-alanyl-D-alanine ligase [Candidatus Brocadia sp. WS118]